jgi:RND family efflux transporter MFP subunit
MHQHTEADDLLRRENEQLRRELENLKRSAPPQTPAELWHPSATTMGAIFLAAAVLILVAFLGGYLPMQSRNAILANEAHDEQTALPRVEVIKVRRSTEKSGLELPGSIQPITETPILARADGYIANRNVDIGDRVKAGQTLAEIDAPELSDQVTQAMALVQQAKSSLEQSIANVEQGKADTDLARITASRSGQLVGKGAVSRQEDDQLQAQYRARLASLHSLEKSIDVQRANLAAAESNMARLQKMQNYRVVKAPFAGVITLRNVDVGTLVTSGSTLLFRVAQTATLRTYVNVPQTYAESIRVGQTASLEVSNVPGPQFTGKIARTSNALDSNSRTLLVEIHVPNLGKALLPGMYAQVQLNTVRSSPPLLVPSDAMIVRSDGAQVAIVDESSVVHLRKIEAGRDYGDRLEILTGIREGDSVIVNPGDVAREGVKVKVVTRPAS